jgi:hypothetical protein
MSSSSANKLMDIQAGIIKNGGICGSKFKEGALKPKIGLGVIKSNK